LSFTNGSGYEPLANVVLVAPEIPQNTGNIIRLCANTGSRLHLVEPLGFVLKDPRLKRASLDYRDIAQVVVHREINGVFAERPINRIFAATTQGSTRFDEPTYQRGDTVLFGSESVGLPPAIIQALPPENVLSIPMAASNRSLNLSNAVAIIVYEIWRQLGFDTASELPFEKERYFS
jgi:tRNA (cytidine/uridine-2'-O-)-methyltransferase